MAYEIKNHRHKGKEVFGSDFSGEIKSVDTTNIQVVWDTVSYSCTMTSAATFDAPKTLWVELSIAIVSSIPLAYL